MIGMNKGLGIGMTVCVLGGIALAEFGGLHLAAEMSVIFGSAVGIILGAVFEQRYALLTSLLAGMFTCVSIGMMFFGSWELQIVISLGIVSGMIIGGIIGYAFEARHKDALYVPK